MMSGKASFGVSTHSRLKAAGQAAFVFGVNHGSFNTQPPEGGWNYSRLVYLFKLVSTHSRLKAAGTKLRINRYDEQFQHTAA